MVNLIKFQIKSLLRTKLFLIINVLTVLFSLITLSLLNNESPSSIILDVIPLSMIDLLIAITSLIQISNHINNGINKILVSRGIDRKQIIISYSVMIFILSIYLSIICLLVSFAYTYKFNILNEFLKNNILIYFAQILYVYSYGLLSLFIVIAIKKPGQSIAVLFMIPILGNLVFTLLNKFNHLSNISNYFLPNIGTNLTSLPSKKDVISIALILLIYIVIFNIISIINYKKQEIN